MVSRWTRVKKGCRPLWDVAKADLNDISQKIQVKVKKPLGEDSHIKIKGNALTSEWFDLEDHFFYVGGEQFRIHSKTDAIKIMNDLADSETKAQVRLKQLEQQLGDRLWVQQLSVHKDRK